MSNANTKIKPIIQASNQSIEDFTQSVQTEMDVINAKEEVRGGCMSIPVYEAHLKRMVAFLQWVEHTPENEEGHGIG